jgi:hypothetical protein
MRTMELTCILGAGLLCGSTLRAAPGDNCANPIVVTLPAALPFADLGQHTCGRGNDYHDANTCIGDFNGSEDIIYQLHVTATVDIEIVMDPKGQGFTAIALDETCPPGGSLCLAFCRDTFDTPRTLGCLRLAPGNYCLMVDCWPLAGHTCIPDFDLTINACECAAGACCVDSTCVGTMTRPLCLAQNGTWFEGFTCNSFACPVEVATLPERCETAYSIAGLPFAARIYNGTATATADGPPGSCNDPNALLMRRDVWFQYTPASDCTLKLNVEYDLYDGLTVVYAGPDSGHLTELHCLNSGPVANPDRDSVAFAGAAGTAYWIQLGARRGGGGINLLVLRPAETVLRGDVDCDRHVGFGDINPFVLLLSNPVTWQAVFPGCPLLNGDINSDGTTDFGDINPFVTLLSGGG